MTDNTTLHIRFEGKSWDIRMADLDIGAQSSDEDVRASVARFLEVSRARFAPYVVERHANGNVTLRPEATFG
jgi:hypothetical protein